MIEISCLDDIAALRESFDVECKLAEGRDGQGRLPKDAWKTYSAFANTYGGDIFLGLKENNNYHFELKGVINTQKVLDELWTNLQNTQKVSANILHQQHVNIITIDGKDIIHIHVPQASRKQKPLYLNNNPLTGTYKRFNSADICQGERDVRAMLAEQIEDSRDAEILKGYGLDDLAMDSFNVYRQMYSNRQPDHPWNEVGTQDFLYNIGAWGKDRHLSSEGLTRAGLLMFGKLRAIKDAYPNYMLDYQEREEPSTNARWVDRLTLDGMWSGNVFDFYLQVIRKLTADLKVPFHLEGDQRQDDTPVHKALREALVNTLVHADFSGRASILIVKRPDMFGFRNPGLMRVPHDIAMNGGESDCRNRLLQDMFRFIGLGENAGSGLPKIYSGWSSQHWRSPVLQEKQIPSDQTLLELHMMSLFPDEVIVELRHFFGEATFDALNENERLVLVTAQIEKTVNHRRMMEIMTIHPSDLSSIFSKLTEKGNLHHEGSGKGTIYFLADARLDDLMVESEEGAKSSEGLGDSSGGLSEQLYSLASRISSTKRAKKEEVEAVILELCTIQALSLGQLMKLLNRSEGVVRKDYLSPLMRDKKLKYKFPTKPQHPEQAYITESSS